MAQSLMASSQAVKRYLAYWFQLGKKVIVEPRQEVLCPESVIEGNRYSVEFEECWRKITEMQKGDCYLQGTSQTIRELLSPKWEIIPCARCDMPVPMVDLGRQEPHCPCSDLENWPNNELPPPREPIDNHQKLGQISYSLSQKLTSKTPISKGYL